MDAALISALVTTGIAALAVAAGRQYFRHVRMDRPPVGVFNRYDVLFVCVMLVVIPPLYLRLPRWLVSGLLVLITVGILYAALVPLVRRRAAVAAVAGLAAAEIALVWTGHAGSTAFIVLNDVALVVVAVGVCNIWAQSGIRARDVALFAAAVAGYDLVATGLLPLTVQFFTRLQALPFSPTVGWGHGGAAVVMGLGDLLFVVLWPVVVEKAFSPAAARWAAAGTLGCVVVAFLALWLTSLRNVPTMVLIGPVICAHWWWLRRRFGRERTAGEYEAAARPGSPPLPAMPRRPVADLEVAAARLDPVDPAGPYRYLAILDGQVVATGADPGGAARAAAAHARQGAVPVLLLGPP